MGGTTRRGGEGIDVSVVVPLFNERESIGELAERLRTVLDGLGLQWEAWFMDDGSTDGSFDVLRSLHESDARFRAIRFRRNYGKSAALAVGFERVRGRIVVTMDADLQDDPDEIPRLIAKLDEGYDMVSGWKKKRYDPISKTIPSRFFNFITRLMTGIEIHDFNCGLKAYRREVVQNIDVYGEMHRYIPVLARMGGFSVSEIPVRHHPRKYGKTKFGASRFFKGFLDLLTVLFTSRYTQRPLHVFGSIGTALLLLGLAANAWLTVEWLLGKPISNRPLLLLGILLMLVGVQLVLTGLLAEMVTKREHRTTEYRVRDELDASPAQTDPS
ncbi:MAG: glycosyltransferase family 2 protein [Bacteroidota bacterium]|nr:glycosyltransferase family 2 protein [Bacteroidota bacterium]